MKVSFFSFLFCLFFLLFLFFDLYECFMYFRSLGIYWSLLLHLTSSNNSHSQWLCYSNCANKIAGKWISSIGGKRRRTLRVFTWMGHLSLQHLQSKRKMQGFMQRRLLWRSCVTLKAITKWVLTFTAVSMEQRLKEPNIN